VKRSHDFTMLAHRVRDNHACALRDPQNRLSISRQEPGSHREGPTLEGVAFPSGTKRNNPMLLKILNDPVEWDTVIGTRRHPSGIPV
jgi:hypothetical protein